MYVVVVGRGCFALDREPQRADARLCFLSKRRPTSILCHFAPQHSSRVMCVCVCSAPPPLHTPPCPTQAQLTIPPRRRCRHRRSSRRVPPVFDGQLTSRSRARARDGLMCVAAQAQAGTHSTNYMICGLSAY